MHQERGRTHTRRTRGDLRSGWLLIGICVGNRCRLGRGERGPGVSNWRVFGGLGASLGFFTIAIDIVIDGTIQAEGAELNCGTIDLVTVPRHADRLSLIKNASRIKRRTTRGLGGGRSSSGGSQTASLVLLLRC